MEVVGVRVEMPSNQPIVLLKKTDENRNQPNRIGAVEATAIAFAQQGVLPARPLTHDLFRDVLDAFEVQLRTVNITALREGIFFADLVFSNGVEVSARPSDSIALALRTGASSSPARTCWKKRASPSRTSRRTRWRSSASSSTRSRPRTSAAPPEAVRAPAHRSGPRTIPVTARLSLRCHASFVRACPRPVSAATATGGRPVRVGVALEPVGSRDVRGGATGGRGRGAA